MPIIKVLLAMSMSISVCIAQDINISGTVKKSDIVGISGAVVMLEKNGIKDTTGNDGVFTLTDTDINFNINKSHPHKFSASICTGVLYLNLQERSLVEIIIYDIQGKIVSKVQKKLKSGAHTIKLPQLVAGVYIYKIKACSGELIIKSLSIFRSSASTSLNTIIQTPTAFSVNKKHYSRFDDVIEVTKDGYLKYRVMMTNSDTSGIEIMMIACADTVMDVDGNVYQAVKIGNQVWTVENLRSTKYNDGSAIPHVPDNAAWVALTTPGYCYYNNATHTDTIKKWGALYNWYVVAPTNPKQIAPAGWHVPTDAEWDTLQNYLIANGYNWDGTTTGNKIAKSMAARTDWWNYSTTGTVGCNLSINNASGFSALPGGSRADDGDFYGQSNFGNWWSATESGASSAYLRCLHYYYCDLYRINYIKHSGFSVRLLRD